MYAVLNCVACSLQSAEVPEVKMELEGTVWVY